MPKKIKEKLVLIKSILLGFAPIWVTIGLICKFGFNIDSLTCGAVFTQAFFCWITAEILHSQGKAQYAPQLKLKYHKFVLHDGSGVDEFNLIDILIVNMGNYPIYNLSAFDLSGPEPTKILQEPITLGPNSKFKLTSIPESKYLESELKIIIECFDILGEKRSYQFKKLSNNLHWFSEPSKDRKGILLDCYDDLLTAYRSWRKRKKRNTLNKESLSAALVYCDKDKV